MMNKNRTVIWILSVFLFFGLLPQIETQAAQKPGKPVITLEVLSGGTDVKVTIRQTANAQGYKIMMKAPGEAKYKKVATLKKDGTAVRTHTVKDLTEGKYSIKVRAYTKTGSKTVWGSYSKAKSISVKKQASGKVVSDYSKAKTGEYIIFGSYEQDNDLTNGKELIEWLALSNDGKELFLVSKYALDAIPFNDKLVDVTWETCSLRKWLNEYFYNTAFDTEQKEKIKTTAVENSYNSPYQILGGNDTKDKIFLLSLVEISDSDLGFSEEYWTEDENRRCAPTIYAVAKGAYAYTGTDANYQTKEGEGVCEWLLRSPGYVADRVALVDDGGDVFPSGYLVDCSSFGVRPALVIKLK